MQIFSTVSSKTNKKPRRKEEARKKNCQRLYHSLEICLKQVLFKKEFTPREGVIIECPLNELFHDVVIVILTSRMVINQIFLTVAVS